jgi:hypothetical protein
MYPTSRQAKLIIILAGLLAVLALGACGRPEASAAATDTTAAIDATDTTATIDATTTATIDATATADTTATIDATTTATIDATTTATPTPLGDTDPFTGTGELTGTVEVSGTADISPTNPVAVAIGEYFDVPVVEVIALHQDGLGFGEIARAYFLARELAADADPSNDLTAAQILVLHQGGLGWGQIVFQLRLPQGNSARNLGLIMSTHKQHADAVIVVVPATSDQDVGHGPPAVPPGLQKNKGKDKPHGNGNAGGNGKGRGNGGGHGKKDK